MVRRRKEDRSAFARALLDFRGRIISGLIVLVPLGITVFILKFLFDITAGNIADILNGLPWGEDRKPPSYVINILALSVLLLVLYFVGVIAAHMVGRRLIELGEAILARIPLVKSVYSASKQVVDAFSLKDKATTFRAVAFVEFPSKGLRSIGFVTGTLVDENGRMCYRVFIPTTPNPTTGYLLVMHSEDVCLTDFTMEEACKMIMSGGIIFPDTLSSRVMPPVLTTPEPRAESRTSAALEPVNGDGSHSRPATPPLKKVRGTRKRTPGGTT
jgi:uncharacterized membrane protein